MEMRILSPLALLASLLIACAAPVEDGPSDEELASLDSWAETSGGKADLPTSFSELVEYLKRFYRDRMSAIWDGQAHPATAPQAMQQIHARARAAGIADPTRARYRTTVRKLVADPIDHSEINIEVARGQVVRLVGDPKGAGVFFDDAVFADPVGPRLCMTWQELETAVTASYAPGAYGLDFVCHNVTERVLRALDIGTARYASQVRTYAVAKWIWGPLLPSLDSNNPGDWEESRACP